jgi:hypothetical protein
MDIFYFFKILFIIYSSFFRLTDKKCIMSISCGMSLRLKEGIKIPKRWLYISVCFHLFKPHLSKNLYELLFSFHQNMKITILYFSTLWIRIEFFKMSLFPWSIRNHSACQISNKFNSILSVLRSFWNYKMSFSFLFNEFSLL